MLCSGHWWIFGYGLATRPEALSLKLEALLLSLSKAWCSKAWSSDKYSNEFLLWTNSWLYSWCHLLKIADIILSIYMQFILLLVVTSVPLHCLFPRTASGIVLIHTRVFWFLLATEYSYWKWALYASTVAGGICIVLLVHACRVSKISWKVPDKFLPNLQHWCIVGQKWTLGSKGQSSRSEWNKIMLEAYSTQWARKNDLFPVICETFVNCDQYQSTLFISKCTGLRNRVLLFYNLWQIVVGSFLSNEKQERCCCYYCSNFLTG